MGKSRRTPAKAPPPPVESEEEEEEVVEEEESEGGVEASSESEEDSGGGGKTMKSAHMRGPSSSKKRAAATPPEDEDDDSADRYIVQAIAATATPSTAPKKSALKAGSSTTTRSTSAHAQAGTKRPAVTEPVDNVDSKRAKGKEEKAINGEEKANNGEEKKAPFTRVFSEEDEIVILKEMAEFSAKTKQDPFIRIEEFHKFINDKIGGDKAKFQLLDKMKRLKKRYDNHMEKVLKSGKERNLTNQHDLDVYNLSKKLWGNVVKAVERETSEGVAKGKKSLLVGSGSTANDEVKEDANDEVKEESRGVLTIDESVKAEWYINASKKLMEESERIEFEKKLNAIKSQECAIMMKKHQLMMECLEKVRKDAESRLN